MDAKLIEVLGPGCAKCELLARYAGEAAQALGLEYHIEKVKDPAIWARYGVTATPALVVDGRLKLQGRVESAAKLRAYLS